MTMKDLLGEVMVCPLVQKNPQALQMVLLAVQEKGMPAAMQSQYESPSEMYEPRADWNTFTAATLSGKFTRIQDAVLAEFSKNSGDINDAGRDINDVIAALESRGVRGLAREAIGVQVREAVGYLAGEGHLYSTIDEAHFKSTAC